MAALAVVLPMICARAFGKEDLVYIRKRLEMCAEADLLEALEILGDTADRVGNPIAAALSRVGEIVRDRRLRAESERPAEERKAAATPEQARAFLAELRERIARNGAVLSAPDLDAERNRQRAAMQAPEAGKEIA